MIRLHFFPCCMMPLISVASSLSDHFSCLIDVSRWFSHLSLHCLPFRKYCRSDRMYSSIATSFHRGSSSFYLRMVDSSSSSLYCQRCFKVFLLMVKFFASYSRIGCSLFGKASSSSCQCSALYVINCGLQTHQF